MHINKIVVVCYYQAISIVLSFPFTAQPFANHLDYPDCFLHPLVTFNETQEGSFFQGTRKDRCTCLLEIISNKDNQAYNNFIASLEVGYPWLHDALRQMEKNGDAHSLEKQVFQDALVLGDVPRRPPNYVDREEPVSQI